MAATFHFEYEELIQGKVVAFKVLSLGSYPHHYSGGVMAASERAQSHRFKTVPPSACWRSSSLACPADM